MSRAMFATVLFRLEDEYMEISRDLMEVVLPDTEVRTDRIWYVVFSLLKIENKSRFTNTDIITAQELQKLLLLVKKTRGYIA